MDKVRVGIIGIGNMGTGHMKNLMEHKVEHMCLTAVCDIDPERLDFVRKQYNGTVKCFDDYKDLLSSGEIDAVIIATPHYFHPPMAQDAFAAGLHVLTEKPAGVYTKAVREMNEAAKKSGKVFGIMYNQRTNPVYQKLRDLVQSGELGNIKRTNWIITNWYRPQAYHDSSAWRSTWDKEGGGVLINQDPHQLDLWQWICGMPKKVHAFCKFGSYYNIEVEDDVTAFVEYENGATGLFVTSTGEYPGTNRFEISGTRGKIVVEDDVITFWRTREDERAFNEKNTIPFGRPETWKCEVPVEGENLQHVGILRNFADAVLNGTPLLAPGEEGILGLSISNAIHLSAWTNEAVTFPIDEEKYYRLLQDKIAHSTFQKNVKNTGVADLKGTH